MPIHVSSAMCSSSGGHQMAVPCTGRPPIGVIIPDAV